MGHSNLLLFPELKQWQAVAKNAIKLVGASIFLLDQQMVNVKLLHLDVPRIVLLEIGDITNR